VLDIDPLRDGVTPVPAATVVLLRDGAAGLEVFLVQRHHKQQFMGGATVFPGGKLDAGDSVAAVLERTVGRTADEAAALLGEEDRALALALHVAALRETLEESGVLLGTATGDVDALRAALNVKGAVLAPLLSQHAVTLDAGALVPLSRWVTPAVEQRRFDARFFLAEVAPGTRAAHDTQETIAGAWLTPAEAIARHGRAEIDLPPPTLRTLELLAPFARASEALADARSRRPPVVRPVFRDLSGQWILAIPGDPEHPEKEPVLAGPTRFSAKDLRWFSG
jgi:8-oxo-dGTP pyrophosphatase MutT (NUDIX family)